MTQGGLTQIDSKMREWKHRETTQQRRRSDLVEDRRGGGEDLSWGKIQPYDSPFTEEDMLFVRFWKRYIYLWIYYALYEELVAEDVKRAREVYRQCLNLIPHKKFSIAKIWILAAKFEIRHMDLKAARLILGNAIGKAPTSKIFMNYIEIELQLGNIDRCRTLYGKYVLWNMQSCYAYIKYAEFEKCLGETERAKAIFELALSQEELDSPDEILTAYIDIELSEFEFDRARKLYERQLDRMKQPLEVWKRYAKFEAEGLAKDEDDAGFLEEKRQCIKCARRVFERALDYFPASEPDKKEGRSRLLEEWLHMEAGFGNLGDYSIVQPLLPKKLKRMREVETEDGSVCYEEYIDYLFPEESDKTNLKILEAAYRWIKKRKFSDEDEYQDFA